MPAKYLEKNSIAATLPKTYWPQMAIVNTIQPETGVDIETLRKIGEASVTTPETFSVHKRLERQWKADRLNRLGLEASKKQKQIDWATGETLGFGSLLLEGQNVRLSGQDSERGTFSHRHSVLHDQDSDDTYVPLNNIESGAAQGRLSPHSSHLSEFAVMGYEYG